MENQATSAACEPQQCLKTVCEQAFEGDRAKTALALGRTQDEIADMLSGNEPVDADLDMKVHGIAKERGIELG